MAQKKVAAKKSEGNNKRSPKANQAEQEKPELDVEASEEESDASDEENDATEVKGAADLIDSEAEESEDDEEDDDDDDEEEDDDEVEPGQISLSKSAAKNNEQSDSDEEPTEAPITKKKEVVSKKGIPKISIGRIPAETPRECQLFVTKLPVEYKHQELVALFAKFGQIIVVNRIKTKAGGNNVVIAFENEEAVESALAAKPKSLTLNGQVLNVSRPHSKEDLNERTIAIGLIGADATKEQITKHFQSCGDIENINFSNNKSLPTAYLRFKSIDSLPKALKLHGSEFHSRFITVRKESYKSKSIKSPECTLLIVNTGNHETYNIEILEKIFKKPAELVDLDVVCTRGILGFATYQTAEDVQKVLKALNGKTVSELEIKLEPYHYSSSVRTVLVTNLANGVEEEEIRSALSAAGEIESVKMLPNKAIVRFTTDDGFCQSFMQNERIIQGQPIFIEPNSNIKHKILQNKLKAKNPNFQFNGARKQQSGGPPAKFQKFGNNNNKYNNNNSNNNNKKPFNKRRAQENGSASNSFKKAKKV